MEMKERPANLSAAEVRGILDGTLTSFRRPIRPPRGEGWRAQGVLVRTHADLADPWFRWERSSGMQTQFVNLRCPFGKPGDRLWVRETWALMLNEDPRSGGPGPGQMMTDADGDQHRIAYCATDDFEWVDGDGFAMYRKDGSPASRWRSSPQMPRWASRIDLEVVESQPEKDAAGVWVWVVNFKRVQT